MMWPLSRAHLAIRGSARCSRWSCLNLMLGRKSSKAPSFRTREQRRGLLTQSYALGPTTPPLLTQTIPEHFASTVSAHGDRNAVISRAQSTILTYRDLDEQSDVIARGLRERGVGKGDRVAVCLGNNWEFAAITYAVWKIGGILVPLNPAFYAPQVTAALSHLEAAHLIFGTETNLPYKSPRENISLIRALVPDLEASTLSSPSLPSLKNIILLDNSHGRIDTSPYQATTPFEDLLNGGLTLDTKPKLNIDEIVNIQFTSGTTSTPKAASLSHRSILNNGYFIGLRMGLTLTDIVCCPPPLFHCFGSVLGYMATATHGSAILFPSEAFSPLASLQACQEYGATALYGVPTMFLAELELLANGTVEKRGFENLRTGIAAGSSVPSVLMKKLHRELNLTGLTICYGMTETSPVSCMTTPTDPLHKRVDSVGQLMSHVEAKIVSVIDRSVILPVGEKGELVVSGYLVMKEYWGDVSRTEEVRTIETYTDEHGQERKKVWMHTGDEALMDEDGYVKITGRIKDLIIRGGENIHPLEVENALLGHERISEVSVVGMPSERYGEEVAAFVVVHERVRVGVDDAGKGNAEFDTAESNGSSGEGGITLTKHAVREWVRKYLSNHLVPKYVFWVKEYPKTASGKVQKFKLREIGVQLLADAVIKPGEEGK